MQNNLSKKPKPVGTIKPIKGVLSAEDIEFAKLLSQIIVSKTINHAKQNCPSLS